MVGRTASVISIPIPDSLVRTKTHESLETTVWNLFGLVFLFRPYCRFMLVQGRRQNWTFSYSRVLGRQKTSNRKTKIYDKNNFIWKNMPKIIYLKIYGKNNFICKYAPKIILSENIHQKIIYPKYMPKIINLKIYGKNNLCKIYAINNLSQKIRQK